MEEKCGHVKGAFHRKDIGYIDLIWGNESGGLCHIVKRRKEQGISVDEFAEDISDIVQNGDLCESSGKYEIWHRKKMVVATKTFCGIVGPAIRTPLPELSISRPLPLLQAGETVSEPDGLRAREFPGGKVRTLRLGLRFRGRWFVIAFL